MTTLHRAIRNGVTLEEALAALAGRGMTGLIYTPDWGGLVRFTGTNLQTGVEQVGILQVFEARLFDDALEVRWLRDPYSDGTGRAVCFSEQTLFLEDWTALPQLTELCVVEGRYVLVGQGCGSDELEEGWSRLSSASIGCITAPIGGVPKGDRVALDYREYLGRADGEAGRDGNWVVREERLLNLTLAKEDNR